MNTEDRILSATWKNASPELLNLWKNLPAAFLASINAATATITSLYFQGAIAGSEFLTYNAKKIYVALRLIAANGAVGTGVSGDLQTYNEADAAQNLFHNQSAYNDGGLKLVCNDIIVLNLWFSRVVLTNYTSFAFNGYKIVIP